MLTLPRNVQSHLRTNRIKRPRPQVDKGGSCLSDNPKQDSALGMRQWLLSHRSKDSKEGGIRVGIAMVIRLEGKYRPKS